jgi:hypothetical protein
MRDVNNGWLIRYAHANGASFFFLCVYIHIARGLYYGSFNKPRVELWSVGVTIFILMMAYFYILPYNKINLGRVRPKYNDFKFYYIFIRCFSSNFGSFEGVKDLPFYIPITPAVKRIGPHNFNILSTAA